MDKKPYAFVGTMLLSMSIVAGCKKSSSPTVSTGGSGSAAAGGVPTASCPGSASKTVPSGADIKVGITLPQSGPFAALTTLATGVLSYFDKVNAAGGVDGHKLKLIVKDDAYDPAKTVVADNALVNQDNVFATVAQLGTPHVAATEKLHEQTCVPQLWVSTGSSAVAASFTIHPWTTSGLLSYTTEAAMWAQHIKAHKSGANVAVLALNNDFGKEYTNEIQKLASSYGYQVSTVQLNDATAASITSQVTAILSKNPDFVLGATGGSYCPKLIQGLAQGGYKGQTIVSEACSSVRADFVPVDPAGNGVLSIAMFPDAKAPADVQKAGVAEYVADVTKYGSGASPSDNTLETGYNSATLFVKALRDAEKLPGGLTRINLMNAAWLLNYRPPLSIGGSVSLNRATDRYAIEFAQMDKYDASQHAQISTGETFDVEGKSGSN